MEKQSQPEMFEYPALFVAADRLSGYSQRLYLWLIRGEYGLLLSAAVLTWTLSALYPGQEGSKPAAGAQQLYLLYVFVFVISLCVMWVRNLKKPEQDWYRARALAESIKTSAWRYAMRAEPFGDADQLSVRRAEFRAYLQKILGSNRLVGERMHPDAALADHITPSMEQIRALDLEARKAFYLERRILDQRAWYAGKAKANKRASQIWFALGVCTYVVILFLVLSGTAAAHEHPATGILVVAASSMLGWVQIRKFNELVSSYTLTSLEIGIVQGKSLDAQDEKAFSDFVNEAELAFSREHIQWVARGGGGAG